MKHIIKCACAWVFAGIIVAVTVVWGDSFNKSHEWWIRTDDRVIVVASTGREISFVNQRLIPGLNDVAPHGVSHVSGSASADEYIDVQILQRVCGTRTSLSLQNPVTVVIMKIAGVEYRRLGIKETTSAWQPGAGILPAVVQVWIGSSIRLPLWAAVLSLTCLNTMTLRWLIVKPALCRWRRRNGYCEECGYDLRGSRDCCPECGKLKRVRLKWATSAMCNHNLAPFRSADALHRPNRRRWHLLPCTKPPQRPRGRLRHLGGLLIFGPSPVLIS